MRLKRIEMLGLSTLLLLISARDGMAFTVTTANDYVQFTNQNPATYTGTETGSYTIASTSYNASGSLQVIRSNSSLDYLWSATPDFANTKGVGIRAVEDFVLSDPADFQLTFMGSYLDGYLLNTSSQTYVEKFGYKSGNVGPRPNFTLSGSLLAGSYELRLNTGALPTDSPKSGEVRFSTVDSAPVPVPIPGAVWLFGTGLLGIAVLRKKLGR